MADKTELREKLRLHGPITDIWDSGRTVVESLLMEIGGEDVRWADTVKRAIGIAPGRDPENLVPLYEDLRIKLIETDDPDAINAFVGNT